MHTFICTNSYAQIHMHTFICTNSYAQIHMHKFICTNSYAQIHMHKFVCIRWMYAMHKFICMNILCTLNNGKLLLNPCIQSYCYDNRSVFIPYLLTLITLVQQLVTSTAHTYRWSQIKTAYVCFSNCLRLRKNVTFFYLATYFFLVLA